MKRKCILLFIVILTTSTSIFVANGAWERRMQAVGQITHTSSTNARGSWKFRFDFERKIHDLDIRINVDGSLYKYEGLGGRSGFYGTGTFMHVYQMNRINEDAKELVYVFAWGDSDVFEAAVLPNTPDSHALWLYVRSLHHSEVLNEIKMIISNADYVIFGVTKNLHH